MQNNSLYMAKLCMLQKSKKNKRSTIANFILSNIEDIDKLTLSSIANATDTSYATVCRFFKDIDVFGFKEFKNIIRSELKNHNTLEFKLDNYILDSKDVITYNDIIHNICDFSSSVVANCRNVLKEETVQQIAEHFRKANFIYFAGLGTSAVTALYAHTKMFRLNLNCSFDTDIIILKMKASNMKKGDIMFAISSSGRTKPMIEAANIAKRNGAFLITICDFMQSPLSDISDINICTTIRNSNKYIDMDFPLINGQIAIIDILYSYIYNQSKQYSAIKFNKTTDAVKNDKIP